MFRGILSWNLVMMFFSWQFMQESLFYNQQHRINIINQRTPFVGSLSTCSPEAGLPNNHTPPWFFLFCSPLKDTLSSQSTPTSTPIFIEIFQLVQSQILDSVISLGSLLHSFTLLTAWQHFLLSSPNTFCYNLNSRLLWHTSK